MRQIQQGFETSLMGGVNHGAVLDTTDPIQGLGSLRIDTAQQQYYDITLRDQAMTFWFGFHFMVDASSWTELIQWNAPGYAGGQLRLDPDGYMWALVGTEMYVARGNFIFHPDTLYHVQCEVWFSTFIGGIRTRVNNAQQSDIAFHPARDGRTDLGGEGWVKWFRLGSIAGMGTGNLWLDDFVVNDSVNWTRSNYFWPGIVTLRNSQIPLAEGNYKQWVRKVGESGPKYMVPIYPPTELPAINPQQATFTDTVTIDNVGDQECPFNILIVGPTTSSVTLTRTGDGKQITLTQPIPTGCEVVIEMGPREVVFWDRTGPTLRYEDWGQYITGASDWFWLNTGNNIFTFSPNTISVLLGWTPYYLGDRQSFIMPNAPAAPAGDWVLDGVSQAIVSYRLEDTVGDYKIIPGLRQSGTDYWDKYWFPNRFEHVYPIVPETRQVAQLRWNPFTSLGWSAGLTNGMEFMMKQSNNASQEE